MFPAKSSRKPGTSRRQFAKSCAALAAGSISSTWLQLQMTQSLAAASPGDGYRALVCLFLGGGNDSFNMLVPNDPAEYADYSSARGGSTGPGLAIPQSDLLPIVGDGGRPFGLHPAMTQLHDLYQQNQLALVANVGSLVQPVDLAAFRAEDERLPLGLFSHSDLTRHWQTATPRSRDAMSGWGGRMADILTDPSRRYDPISMNIAIDSVNVFQSAQFANPYAVTAGGADSREGYFGDWHRDKIFRIAHQKMLARDDANLFKKTHSAKTSQAIEAAELYNSATAGVTLPVAFPTTDLGSRMERIARTIAAREALDHTRQIFFIQWGNWDHHGALLGPHNENLTQVDGALAAFHQCMEQFQLGECVCTFTASDFGRTLAGNGQGSDHGWGGNQMVLGGQVAGGKIYGDYPSTLALNSGSNIINPLDVGRGRLIPTTSVDQYAAEMAMWFGIGNNEDLETILPNIRTFYSTGDSGTPLGLFG